MSFLRNVLAVIVGVIVASIAVFIGEVVGHIIFPPPEHIDVMDPNQLKTVIDELPLGALIAVIFAWAFGSFVGGFVTAKVAKSNRLAFPFITGGILMIFGLMTIVTIPHPMWFTTFGLAVYLPSAYLGGMVGINKR